MKSKKKALSYSNVEYISCFAIDKRTRDCSIMYTPEDFPYAIPMNMEEDIHPNIIRIHDNESCTMINDEFKCGFEGYEGFADCIYKNAPIGKGMILQCGLDVLE